MALGAVMALFSKRSFFEARLNPLTLLQERLREQGQVFADLTVSNPTAVGLRAETETALSALTDARALTYRPLPFGAPEARAAVAATYADRGLEVAPSRVVLTASTSEAYSYLFKLLCDPGDEVLVPVPGYPLLAHLAAFECVRPVPFGLLAEDHWAIDRNDLLAAITPRTRAIVLVHPNNPTGSYVDRDELQWLSSLGRPLIGDEVFADFPLRDGLATQRSPARSVLDADRGLSFALGGLSKSLGLPQMKSGWLVVGGHAAVAEPALARLELLADTWLSAATPSQLALPVWLSDRWRLRAPIIARIQRNLKALRDLLGSGSAVSAPAVAGGWSACLRLPAIRSDEEWALTLLADHGVAVHPGHYFGFGAGAWLVISLLTEPATFDDGVARILRAVDRD